MLAPADSSLKISYDINTGKARIQSAVAYDSIFICYSRLPYQLNKRHFRRDAALYDSGKVYRENYRARFMPVEAREELFSSPGLEKTGNISRGISFGNNQNVFVNSTLNLQLEGRLTEDLRITGVISDQNIPFQPEGNTQQIQQFDKVYIQLEGKKTKLTVGDLVMTNQPSSFLRYYRNVQGGQYEYHSIKDSSSYYKASAGIAVAKGKFNSMLFAPGQPDSLLEGVQGPYRLRGPNGERFIIILANSEKVYLDGRPLKRGFDYDYIIDYNQAEVTFTSNVVITRFSRLRIDFEYSDRNFSRTISNFSYVQKHNKLSGFVGYYQEKDNPRNPLTQTLTDADKTRLSLVGDSLQRAFIPGGDSTAYNVNLVLYNRLRNSANTGDSLNINGNPVYIYTVKDSGRVYQVTFSDVGAGNGTYYLSTTSTANGKVYIYDPSASSEQRRYEPVRLVATPKQKSMVVAGGGIELTKYDNLFGEFALSKNDLNLYSPLDAQDDVGKSLKVGYTNKGRNSFIKDYKWTTGIDYEYNEKNFNAIDRFRSPEFERDWSENTKVRADNHIVNLSTGLIKNDKNLLQYKASRRIKGTDVNGLQQYLNFNKSLGNFQVVSSGFYMKNDRGALVSDWKRASVNTFKTTRYVVPGIVYSMDKNIIKDSAGGVTGSAMYFDEMKFYVKNNDTLKTKFFTDYSYRKDKHAANRELLSFTTAQTANAGFNSRIRNNDVSTTLTYRYLHYNDKAGQALPDEENILGRTDWNTDLLKKHVRSELTITTGTGRELRRQIVYIPVQGGTGNYIWLDANNDGVQDLNEFVETNSAYTYSNTTTYMRSYVPTDSYFKAYTNTFNYRLDITAPRSWRNKEGLKMFLSRFSNISSWSLNKKITDNDLLHRFLPTLKGIEEINILTVQQSVRSTLFYNRSNPQYGFDLNFLSSEQKQFLNQGFETRRNREAKLNSRVNVKSYLNTKLLLLNGIKENRSDFLASRNFSIQTWRASPEISYQPKPSIRFTALFSCAYKQNIMKATNRERVTMYEAGGEVKINKVSRRTINGNVRFIRVHENLLQAGTTYNSAIAYEIMEALQPGNNYTWNVNWLEKLSNGLQLTFSYEGRKTGSNKIVHIGRMQVAALF